MEKTTFIKDTSEFVWWEQGWGFSIMFYGLCGNFISPVSLGLQELSQALGRGLCVWLVPEPLSSLKCLMLMQQCTWHKYSQQDLYWLAQWTRVNNTLKLSARSVSLANKELENKIRANQKWEKLSMKLKIQYHSGNTEWEKKVCSVKKVFVRQRRQFTSSF